MKKTISLFAIIAVLFSFSANLSAQTMPLYLNFNSHNEINDPPDYSQPANYNAAKAIVLQLADTMYTYDVRWNMQVESNFIRIST